MVRFASHLAALSHPAPLLLVREGSVDYAGVLAPDPVDDVRIPDASEDAPLPGPFDADAVSGFDADGSDASVPGDARISDCADAAPVPDPFDDADALEELEEEIATLAAHIHAATHRLLTLVAEFDRRRGWELGGHRTCAHWLHARTGIDLGAAREKVRAARALVDLPETSASMARGELSFSKECASYCT